MGNEWAVVDLYDLKVWIGVRRCVDFSDVVGKGIFIID